MRKLDTVNSQESDNDVERRGKEKKKKKREKVGKDEENNTKKTKVKVGWVVQKERRQWEREYACTHSRSVQLTKRR